MELILNRYRNLTVLLVVVVAQLVLIAYQVRTNKDVPLLRVWAVTAVTPVEQVLDVVRRNTWGFVEDYFVLLHTRQRNEALQRDVDRLKLENQYLRTELSTADRVRALGQFQKHSPSKMIVSRIIGNGTGANSKAVFVDRGSGSGVESGMAVLTPDGIVGKVVAAYPTASLVLLITDSNFAAGVISQQNRVHGTLKGQGHDGTVQVLYVQAEEKVDSGEWFYTSGDDRIFPKGFPVGQATTVRNARNLKEIYITPSGFQNGLEEVLIVIDAVHQPIPDVETPSSAYSLIPGPPDPALTGAAPALQTPSAVTTDADRLKDQYRQVGEAQHHTFGQGLPGSIPPDFTKLPGLHPPPAPSAQTKAPATPAPGAPVPANALAPAVAGAKPPGAGGPVSAAAGALNAGGPGKAGASGTATPLNTRTSALQAQTSPSDSALPKNEPKPQPKRTAPLITIDPTDADPSEPPVPATVHRAGADLDEFGQPKVSRQNAAKKKSAGDNNTDILPPAAPPKLKTNGH